MNPVILGLFSAQLVVVAIVLLLLVLISLVTIIALENASKSRAPMLARNSKVSRACLLAAALEERRSIASSRAPPLYPADLRNNNSNFPRRGSSRL
jgi:hypothetical protein